MKYIRTKDENNLIIDLSHNVLPYMIVDDYIDFNSFGRFKIINQADTIEELCDEFVAKDEKSCLGNYIFSIYEMSDEKYVYINEESGEPLLKDFIKNKEVYGAIWTDKGLIYVAKMNDKGELELL